MRRPLLIIALLLACAGIAVITESHTTKPSPLASPAPRELTPEEVTTLPPTTSTALRTTTTHTSRSRVRVQQPSGDDFWRRLANCESSDGRSGQFLGYFQFSRDTAAKVGIDGSESYETQRAAAESWSHQVNPSSTAGWPHCWKVAQG